MRVLHAPTNIANQMTALSRGLRACGVEATTCEFESQWLQYPVDMALHLEQAPTRMHLRLRRLRFFLWAATRFDVFHFHYGESLISRNRDLVWLERLGRRMVMHYWGSDVRPHSLDPHGLVEPRRQRRLRRVARRIPTAAVADGELRSYVEPFFDEIAMVRQAIDLEAFAPCPPPADISVPLVVHAPTSAAYKGTAQVLAAVEQLRSRQRFEFVLVENTPHHVAMEVYRRADIVIDQIKHGTHGLFAVEAMALAKPVVCYINPAWRSGYPSELPLVSASAETLVEELAALLANGQRRRQVGEAGRAYVERYHDARVVAEGLCAVYRRGAFSLGPRGGEAQPDTRGWSS